MNIKRIYLPTVILLILSISLSGQGNTLFGYDKVHEIRLTFESDNYWSILSSNYDNSPSDVPYEMATAEIDGNTVDSIGVRLKGFSSYFFTDGNKKSIKLDFNEFVKGKRYDGLRKVNLNNGQGDPAMQRDAISYELMRRVGVPAPRTGYAKVYLNDTYWGLYLLVEQIDKEFLADNYGTKEGNLFKNMDVSDLGWLGEGTLPYQNIFDLKTGDEENAWENFVELTRQLNFSSDETFQEEIEKVFDVDQYLKVLMVDVALNNWDSYIEHGRNFYIYENPNSNQFQWVPWDYNLAMGGNFNIGGGGGGPWGPDVNDCLTVQNGSCPHPVDDFTLQIVMSLDETCCSQEWTLECENLWNQFQPTPPEECPSILNGSCPYPADDPVFLEVISFDPFCCDFSWESNCQELYDDITNGEGPGNDDGNFPIDMRGSDKILIDRLLGQEEYREIYYKHWCNFLENDFSEDWIFPLIDQRGDLIREGIEADPNYIWSLTDFEADLEDGTNQVPGLKTFISERVPLLKEQLQDLTTCNVSSSALDFQDIVVNEFCASCDSLSGISDANGDFDDWIELYNNTDESIDLSNAYLSDDRDEPLKWRFPLETKLNADSYLIVWADKDDGQDGLHSNFKLAKDGEFIMITVDDTVLDSFAFNEQETNLTLARIPNGTGEFVQTDKITFGFNNEETTSAEELFVNELDIKMWPNPVAEILNLKFDKVSNPSALKDLRMSLSDGLGKEVIKQPIRSIHSKFEVGHLPQGMYMLSVSDLSGRIIETQKLIKLIDYK